MQPWLRRAPALGARSPATSNVLSATRRGFSTVTTTRTSSSASDFTHAVIGAGVVGLAVARSLAARAGGSTLLLERHAAVGTETSSRNSEVIHAGIYYGPGTLKTSLCTRGRELLYALCSSHGIPHRRTGKWIVAQNDAQLAALERLAAHCARPDVDVPLRWVGREEAARREPFVRAEKGVLESPVTGIVDSHALMLCLLGQFEDAGGTLALSTAVEEIRPLGGDGSSGWSLAVRDAATGERSTVTADTIVNAAGLGAVAVHNMIVPPDRRRDMFYAKGNYFSYTGGAPRVSTLVYPAPEPGHAGLGTHLTLDLAGRMRFGPDVEWVESPDDLTVSEGRREQTAAEVKKYLPGLDEEKLQPDYAGIRPKLGRQGAVLQGKGFVDFVVQKEEGYAGWVNLLGIESPGLTSSLAIAERVRELLYG
ncbi:hypothetical protein VTJ83DRAFT_4990 [Remersonia thermophila]|uniref:L-2-hydroxyglutarate dehydrogenase, mitochondrial n=1 Tax=Remersonia thermophila TaxID=72144 RepID=A0ABR4DBH8_9PEZI